MRGWLAKKLDALASSVFSVLGTLASGEARQQAAVARITSKLDALASTVASKLDALSSSIASLLTLLAGVKRTLDAVNGKLDKLDDVLGRLGLVAATVSHVDAKGDLAGYARKRETRRVIRAVRRLGGSVRWVGRVALIGLAAVLVLLVSGRVRWVHDEEPATASVRGFREELR